MSEAEGVCPQHRTRVSQRSAEYLEVIMSEQMIRPGETDDGLRDAIDNIVIAERR